MPFFLAYRPVGLFSSVGILLLLFATLAIALKHLHLPQAPENIGTESFSAKRALLQLQQIARKPHPLGSAEHQYLQTYLVGELNKLGLQVQLQTGVGIAEWSIGKVSNIIARLPGAASTSSAPKKAILISAHYDSVANSPGAADDGASVAAILETIRALQTGTKLENDIIVFFSDGEEQGLLGAQLFTSQHPWRQQIGLVLNFEYRGNSGPFWMFESSNGNGKLIAGLQTTGQAYANSLLYEVYRHMPNYTDFTHFKKLGLAGLNFAAGEGHTSYHTQLDTVERLDTASLQHQGEIMLALLRHFGGQDLNQLYAKDVIYFDVPGLGLISYPPSSMWPLLAVTLFALILWRQRKSLRFIFVVLAPCVQLLSVVVVASGAQLLWQLVLWLYPQYRLQLQGSIYNQNWYFLAMLACCVAVFALVQKFWRRFFLVHELSLGAACLFLILLLTSHFLLPGASFVFLWPLLPVLLMLLVGNSLPAQFKAWCWALALVPAVLLLSGIIRLLFLALTPHMAIVSMAVFGLLLCLCTPLFAMLQVIFTAGEHDDFYAGTLSLPLCFSLPLCLTMLLCGSLTANYDAWQPRPNHLAYFYDGVDDKAYWFSRNSELDHWSRGFFSAEAKRDQLPHMGKPNEMLWLSPAPGKLPLPKIEVISDRIVPQRRGNIRSIELSISSSRSAPMMQLELDGAHVYAVQIDGHRMIEKLINPWRLRLLGFVDEPVKLVLEVESKRKLFVKVLDRSDGLPRTGWPERPADIMIEAFRDSNTSQSYYELQM